MIDRRQILAALAGTGIGTPVFHRALVALMQEPEPQAEPKVTAEMIEAAQWISGTEFNEEEREAIAKSVNSGTRRWDQLRQQQLDFDDLPATHFRPLYDLPSGMRANRSPRLTESHPPQLPDDEASIAFLPVTELAGLIRERKISSVELTKLYLSRLEKYNPLLNCVVNITEDLALNQAKQADREIAAGRYRGPLHGIPWGAKDLIAVPGYPTTWGIPQFEQRPLNQTATVAARLHQAGAVLVAKLSLGAIAMGDRWFRGITKSPWNYKTGSSGSSAGSASATSAGLVGFSLGSETLGSIISPCRVCGATGLRPTFGRVSRHGCMPLSWTMDKIGPITRSVEDCALVFAAIHGFDGLDPTAHSWPFDWPSTQNFSSLKIGYTQRQSRRGKQGEQPPAEDSAENRVDLQILKRLGCQLVEVQLPRAPRLLADIIDVEAASVFDDMLRRRETEGWNQWPGIFRRAEFVSAVDFLRLQRRRRQLMFEMQEVMRSVDMLVNTNDLFVTNLTGHPSVVLPQGFRERNGKRVPYSTIFTGQLNDDARLLALALAYQKSVSAHLERPPLDRMLGEMIQEANQEEENAEKRQNKQSQGDG